MIPLQGVPYIRKAAEILRGDHDISFRIIGDGQWVPYEDLPNLIRAADACLGIFGDTDKTLRVIPNKVYEAIAMAKPVISSDTPAIRELFTDRENILLCRRADPEDLAEKILELRRDEQLRTRIAHGGHQLFLSRCTPKIIAADLLRDLADL
ncbi:MAG: glycosyltransferase [Patescibacteria group bacterium]